MTTTGTSFDLTCPAGYLGGPAVGSISGLSGTTGGHLAPGGSESTQLDGTLSNVLLPSGKSGAGMVEFTFTYAFDGVRDVGGRANIADDFLFNGNSVWTGGGKVINVGEIGFNKPTMVVLDEPIEYGVPFSYQQDLELTTSGAFFAFASGSVTPASVRLTTGGLLLAATPEPGTFYLLAAAVLLVATRLRRREPGAASS